MFEELLIACSLKATVILVIAFGLCGALRRTSASIRHLVWTVMFAALLLLPVVPSVMPAVVAQPVRLPSAQANRHLSTPPVSPVRAGIDWVPLVWLAGAALVLGRFSVGTAHVWRKARRSRPMPVAGVSRRVRVLD